MTNYEVPEAAKPYVDALIGCTHDGLYGSVLEGTSLLNLPVVWYLAEGSDSESVRASALLHAVEQVVSTAFKSSEAQVIQALLALGKFGPMKLTGRHEYIVGLLGLESWNQFRDQGRHRELSKLVLALQRQGALMWEREHQDDYLPYLMAQASDADLPSYRLRDYYVSYRYPHDRSGFRELLEVREVVATRPTSSWSGAFDYHADRALLAKVRIFGEAELVTRPAPAPEPGVIRQELEVVFPRVLQPGESYRFVLHKLLPLAEPDDYQEPGDISSIKVTPTVPIERFTVQVHHGGGKTPTRSWHFDRIPTDLVPGDYSEEAAITSDTMGFTQSFTHLRRGLAYGVGWEW